MRLIVIGCLMLLVVTSALAQERRRLQPLPQGEQALPYTEPTNPPRGFSPRPTLNPTAFPEEEFTAPPQEPVRRPYYIPDRQRRGNQRNGPNNRRNQPPQRETRVAHTEGQLKPKERKKLENELRNLEEKELPKRERRREELRRRLGLNED